MIRRRIGFWVKEGRLKDCRRKDDFIAKWIKAARLPGAYYDMFQSEVEIQQGASVYWMPIQEVLLKPFGKEIIAGSKVRLYAMLLGEFKHVPVFAISEFNASEG